MINAWTLLLATFAVASNGAILQRHGVAAPADRTIHHIQEIKENLQDKFFNLLVNKQQQPQYQSPIRQQPDKILEEDEPELHENQKMIVRRPSAERTINAHDIKEKISQWFGQHSDESSPTNLRHEGSQPIQFENERSSPRQFHRDIDRPLSIQQQKLEAYNQAKIIDAVMSIHNTPTLHVKNMKSAELHIPLPTKKPCQPENMEKTIEILKQLFGIKNIESILKHSEHSAPPVIPLPEDGNEIESDNPDAPQDLTLQDDLTKTEPMNVSEEDPEPTANEPHAEDIPTEDQYEEPEGSAKHVDENIYDDMMEHGLEFTSGEADSSEKISDATDHATEEANHSTDDSTEKPSPPTGDSTEKTSPPTDDSTEKPSPPTGDSTEKTSPPTDDSTEKTSPSTDDSTEKTSHPSDGSESTECEHECSSENCSSESSENHSDNTSESIESDECSKEDGCVEHKNTTPVDSENSETDSPKSPDEPLDDVSCTEDCSGEPDSGEMEGYSSEAVSTSEEHSEGNDDISDDISETSQEISSSDEKIESNSSTEKGENDTSEQNIDSNSIEEKLDSSSSEENPHSSTSVEKLNEDKKNADGDNVEDNKNDLDCTEESGECVQEGETKNEGNTEESPANCNASQEETCKENAAEESPEVKSVEEGSDDPIEAANNESSTTVASQPKEDYDDYIQEEQNKCGCKGADVADYDVAELEPIPLSEPQTPCEAKAQRFLMSLRPIRIGRFNYPRQAYPMIGNRRAEELMSPLSPDFLANLLQNAKVKSPSDIASPKQTAPPPPPVVPQNENRRNFGFEYGYPMYREPVYTPYGQEQFFNYNPQPYKQPFRQQYKPYY